MRFPSGLETGEAGWTTGQRLPASWVIHVVGPVYDGTGFEPGRSWCPATATPWESRTSWMRAHRLSTFSVAFPLVSAGVYGWPRADAVEAQVSTLASTRTRVTKAVLVGFDPGAVDLLQAAVARVALSGVRAWGGGVAGCGISSAWIEFERNPAFQANLGRADEFLRASPARPRPHGFRGIVASTSNLARSAR